MGSEIESGYCKTKPHCYKDYEKVEEEILQMVCTQELEERTEGPSLAG